METAYHALLKCKVAKKLWRLAPFQVQIPNAFNMDMLMVLQDICKNLSKAETEFMMVCCWVVWNAGNKFIFEGKKMNPPISLAKVESVVEAYQRVRLPREGSTYGQGA